MNDEQQILKDILDSLYGDENVLKKDTDIIKAKKEERKEKSDEIIPQINNICEKLEEELRMVLGSDTVGLRKKIRLQVLTSIKAEIDNGNSVVDSSGKISAGKTFDIIRQSKSEILERVQFENDTVNYKKEDEDVLFENPQEDKEDRELKNIFEQLEDFGVDLSQEDKDLIAEAIAKVNEILKIVKEKIDSGMTEEEAWESIFEGKSAEEIETLKMYFILAEVTAPFREKDVEQVKDDSGVEEKDSGTKMGTEPKAGKDVTLENEPRKNINSEGFWHGCTNHYSKKYQVPQPGSKFYKLGTTAAKIVSNKAVNATLIYNNPEMIRYLEMFQERTVGTEITNVMQNINGEGAVSKIGNEITTDVSAVMEQMKRASTMLHKIGYTAVTPETVSENRVPKKGKLTPTSRVMMKKIETARPKLGYMRYTSLTPEPASKNGVPKKGKLTSIARVMMEKLKNARSRLRYTTVTPETMDESGAPKKGELTPGTEAIIEQAKRFTTPLHEMRHATVDKRASVEYTIDKEYRAIMDQKIPDEILDPYFEAQNELLAVSLSKENMYTDIPVLGKNGDLYGMRDDDTEIIENKNLSVTPPSAPTSTTPPPPTTSIVEEMTVDASGVTPGEQSGISKKGTLRASIMKALVKSRAEVRKMLEANGIIHGQMPEGPTAGKPEIQDAPMADNNEKSGGEPEEH